MSESVLGFLFLVTLLGYSCNWGVFDSGFVFLYIWSRSYVNGTLGDDCLIAVTIVLSWFIR